MKQSGCSRCLPLLLAALLVYAAHAYAAERHYAPDRKVDMIHVVIDVTPDFGNSTVSGTTILSFVPIAKPLDVLRLDAVDLDVSSVTSSAPTATC